MTWNGRPCVNQLILILSMCQSIIFDAPSNNINVNNFAEFEAYTFQTVLRFALFFLCAAFSKGKISKVSLSLVGTTSEMAEDYKGKKNVMRVRLPDNSSYLLSATDSADITRWLKSIQFHTGTVHFGVQNNYRYHCYGVTNNVDAVYIANVKKLGLSFNPLTDKQFLLSTRLPRVCQLVILCIFAQDKNDHPASSSPVVLCSKLNMCSERTLRANDVKIQILS